MGSTSPMRRLLFPLLLIVLAVPAWSGAETVRVVGIADGDTISVLTADKGQRRVRLHGIDAPEIGQDFGSRARRLASELASGKAVTIRARDTDRHGRIVAEVILPDGRSMNREMVRMGMAWRYREYAPHDGDLARLEAGRGRPGWGCGAGRIRSRPGNGDRAGGTAGRRRGRESAQPGLSPADVPGSREDGREEPCHVRRGCGRGKGRLSEGGGLPDVAESADRAVDTALTGRLSAEAARRRPFWAWMSRSIIRDSRSRSMPDRTLDRFEAEVMDLLKVRSWTARKPGEKGPAALRNPTENRPRILRFPRVLLFGDDDSCKRPGDR